MASSSSTASRQHYHYFFVGIGGSGMSAIAQYLLLQGHRVSGSDRSFDKGENQNIAEVLTAMGIELFPQDGSGINISVDEVITSTAVEKSIPDVGAALAEEIPVIRRSKSLARIHNAQQGIAIGGTSGKSTVTGMVAHVLRRLGDDPSMINGGVALNVLDDELPGIGNVIQGTGPCVVEADESDGSISLYRPDIAVVTNVTLDHKPLQELRHLFGGFLTSASRGRVVNLDCPEAALLLAQCPHEDTGVSTISYSLGKSSANLCAAQIRPLPHGSEFVLDGENYQLAVPGNHNVSNALAAIAVAELLGHSRAEAASALKDFRGIRRRLEVIGTAAGITVIDDFAHNPDKISASLETLHQYPGRLLMVFQPHGFGPTRMLRSGLVHAFVEGMNKNDVVYLPEIYYAGGTTTKNISSQDLVTDMRKAGTNAHFYSDGRNHIASELFEQARPGDRIVIMGARDDTLREFAIVLHQHFNNA